MTKRLFDLVLSFILLIAFAPLLLSIALLIKLSSNGTILYLQQRVGRHNKEFAIIKFRTMYADADKKGLLTIGGRDPRVTRIGYYLRSYKFDELPQLINVLIGNMSFVGPRPEVRKYVALYNQQQQQVLTVKPGITDYASIKYADENELLLQSNSPEKTYVEEIMPAKLLLNLKYIEEKSLLTDLKIILLTIKKIALK